MVLEVAIVHFLYRLLIFELLMFEKEVLNFLVIENPSSGSKKC
jgi:hypothetical protein